MKTCFAIALILCCVSIAASAQNPPAPPTIAPSPSLAKDSKCYEIRTY